MTLVFMTLVIPGSAQLVAGNKKVARVATRTWAAIIATGALLGLISLVFPSVLLSLATSAPLLYTLRIALFVLAAGWAYLFVDAWRLGEPLSLTRNHRLALVGTNGVLMAGVLAVILFSANVVGAGYNLVDGISGSGEKQDAAQGRYNVLLAGGDSGAGRVGLRPDSLTVASIDAATGKTVLIGLPRNMANFPFPKGSVMAKQFPDGWDCDDCMLNGVSTYAFDHPDLFDADSDNVGMDATVEAVEGITGLEISYWALVNLKGFHKLVDAFGGVELNVRDRIPVGLPGVDSWFRYIEPGKRKLNGEETLWFARARHGSDDYSRMARQKCVMSAMVSQVDPKQAIFNIGKIADASSAMLSTSIPGGEFDEFAQLALKARSAKISTVSLVPPKISTSNPDMKKVRKMVSKAIERSENPKKKGKAKTSTSPGTSPEALTSTAPAAPSAPPTLTGGSQGTLKDGYAANESDDLGAAC